MSAAAPSADMVEMAAVDFEPWTDPPEPPTNVEWCKEAENVLPCVRMAWLCCQKTKPEMVELVESITGEQMDGLFDNWREASAYFKAFASTLDCATARMLTAGAVVALRGRA